MADTLNGYPSGLTGKYLTFKLDDEAYGLRILKVQEIIGIMPITHVPKMPRFIRGVINLRGKVIPLVDLRLKFMLAGQPDTERTCVIVVQVTGPTGELTTGLIVDEVSEVLDVHGDQIEPPPSFGVSVDTAFLLGMGKIGGKVIMLLDVERVLTCEEMALMTNTASA